MRRAIPCTLSYNYNIGELVYEKTLKSWMHFSIYNILNTLIYKRREFFFERKKEFSLEKSLKSFVDW